MRSSSSTSSTMQYYSLNLVTRGHVMPRAEHQFGSWRAEVHLRGYAAYRQRNTEQQKPPRFVKNQHPFYGHALPF
jgi:hypothetical protein